VAQVNWDVLMNLGDITLPTGDLLHFHSMEKTRSLGELHITLPTGDLLHSHSKEKTRSLGE
jgi:hypothetical protein